jgi:hypothetical protein
MTLAPMAIADSRKRAQSFAVGSVGDTAPAEDEETSRCQCGAAAGGERGAEAFAVEWLHEKAVHAGAQASVTILG